MKRKNQSISESLNSLIKYIEAHDFAGWDPYDGLNSALFNSIRPFRNSRLMKLVWIQAFKRAPVNLRRPALIKEGHNPKALSLFLSGFVNLYRLEQKEEYVLQMKRLADMILESQTQGYSGACWGYNFPWQSKSAFFPRFHPTVVVSTFAGCALLDAYSVMNDEKYLQAARSACDFILNDLNRTYDDERNFTLSYSPADNLEVYNAGFLGSRLLCRTGIQTGEKELIEAARSIIAYNCARQNSDGSWYYSPLPYHQWIDNFHTGFNMDSILIYRDETGDDSFDGYLEKAAEYYSGNFITDEGVPSYYSDRIFPADIHSAAQMLVTLCRINGKGDYTDLIRKLARWTLTNMQDKKGFFYYRKYRMGTNRIPYMRWSQAWMFFALTTLLEQGIDLHE